MSTSVISNIHQAFSYIDSFTNLERGKISVEQRNYRLDRMNRLLEMFESPHKTIKLFHIAGTKGKGSTAIMLAAVLESAGHKTGVYASPHVASPRERILVSLEEAEKSLVVELVNQIKSRIEKIKSPLPGNFPPTTFELLTLLSFLVFHKTNCRYGAIETGIGGRLDATNVIHPVASVITPMDIEHTDLLGETLKQIAFEKGGIIKRGIPVFCGFQKDEVKPVLNELSVKNKTSIKYLDKEIERLDININKRRTYFDLKLHDREAVSFELGLKGIFQAENAALVYLVLTDILPELPVKAYQQGFRRATLPGRMEIFQTHPPVIIDGAHTPLSTARLLESYKVLYPEKGVLLFGSVAGKKTNQMARLLVPCFTEIIISKPNSFKESDPEAVYALFKSMHASVRLQKNPIRALETAIKLSHGSSPILVTGSFYMISEIRPYLMKMSRGKKDNG